MCLQPACVPSAPISDPFSSIFMFWVVVGCVYIWRGKDGCCCSGLPELIVIKISGFHAQEIKCGNKIVSEISFSNSVTNVWIFSKLVNNTKKGEGSDSLIAEKIKFSEWSLCFDWLFWSDFVQTKKLRRCLWNCGFLYVFCLLCVFCSADWSRSGQEAWRPLFFCFW